MNNDPKAKAIFVEVIELPLEAQPRYLDEACGGDQRLRREVESLLAHHDDDCNGILTTPPMAHGVAAEIRETLLREAEPLRAGERVGPYVVKDRLGQGGMSVVYRAHQETPVQREVAIKILKPGMDSASVLARFETERAALAAMEHPGIARVIDAGLDRHGRPFFAMELIRGVPITTFCNDRRLDVRERIDVFSAVCRAVQHAHMRGVIHRDLKPSNILVEEHEGVAVPKVIDFGVSKAVQISDCERVTQLGHPVGTPEYMSPEQWDSDPDLDVRADVYSLGVVLYELLSGHFPYAFERAESGSVRAVQQALQITDPVRPSARVSNDDRQITSPVGGMSYAELANAMSGDLDWIILKSIEKERPRRYSSVEALTDDLRRFLEHEPIEARPPSPLYRCRLFCKRHQVLAAACFIVALGLMFALAGVSYHVYRINDELDQKKIALARAEAAEAEALELVQELKTVSDYQLNQFMSLDPESVAVRLRAAILDALPESRRADAEAELSQVNFTNTTLRMMDESILTPSQRTVDAEFLDYPLIHARLLHAIGMTYREFGLLEQAVDPMERALTIRSAEVGREHPEVFASMNELVELYLAKGQIADADALGRETLELGINTFGKDDPEVLTAISNVGVIRKEEGKLDEAEPYFREALERQRVVLGNSHPDTIQSISNLGLLLGYKRDFDETETLFREAVELSEHAFGSEDLTTIRAQSNLGLLLSSQRAHGEAEDYFRKALEALRRVLGDEHPDTLSAMNNMGYILEAQTRLAEAEPYYRDALEGRRRALGVDHPATLASMNNFAFLSVAQGKPHDAERHFRTALEGRRRSLGPEHPATVASMENLALALHARGASAEAESLYRAALDHRRREFGEVHALTLLSMRGLAAILNESGRYDDSLELAQRAFEVSGQVLSPDDWQLAEAESILGESLAGIGRVDEAESLLMASYASLDKRMHTSFRIPHLQRAAGRIEALYRSIGNHQEAERWRVRATRGTPNEID